MVKSIDTRLLNDEDQGLIECTLLHPYPGTMPAFLGSRLIDRYSCRGAFILDPFCGSGSVILEALRLGRNCVGTDLLKIPVKIADISSTLPTVLELEDKWKIVRENAMQDLSLFSKGPVGKVNKVDIDNLSKWLHPTTLLEVLSLRNYLDLHSTDRCVVALALLLAGALPSLSRRYSRGTVHWGWIADNVVPKPDDLCYVNCFVEANRRVKTLTRFMAATGFNALNNNAFGKVLEIDWLTDEDQLGDYSFDLMVTSPPYPYSIDYTLALRLSHYLFDIRFDDVRNQEIGARFKRKRKARAALYLDQLQTALNHSSKNIKVGGKSILVLPHPKGYQKILSFSEEEWLEFVCKSLSGRWRIVETGLRTCVQRRVVNKYSEIRREIVAVYERYK